MPDMVAGVVAEAPTAHAAALHDPARSARAFLSEAALRGVGALIREGAVTLIPAMHLVLNTVLPGLVDPEVALYAYWMEWRTSNQSGWRLSMGGTLRLTNQRSATSL